MWYLESRMRKQNLLYEDPSHTVVENILVGDPALGRALTLPAAAAAAFCKSSTAVCWGAMDFTCTRSWSARFCESTLHHPS